MEDGDLVRRARAGDTDAYRCLMLRHQEIAFRAAFLITSDASEAEDAAQDGFVNAFYALDRFRDGAPFRPWLLRIVTNQALNHRRTTGRHTSAIQRAGRAEPASTHAPSPEAIILAAETRGLVLDALDRLDDRDRLVLSYRYLLDMPVAEIATILDCPQRTVRSRITRALKRLATHLETDPDHSTRSERSRA
ncbi:MAG TPA: RNA polymerase sigma factor [Thermomicrobiales bacterium]|nr:RNA polymerase sigma factor [Thermomicrobiales bacterium]